MFTVGFYVTLHLRAEWAQWSTWCCVFYMGITVKIQVWI